MIIMIIILVLIWILIFIIVGAFIQTKYKFIKNNDKRIIITSEIEEKIKNIENYNKKLEIIVLELSKKIKNKE